MPKTYSQYQGMKRVSKLEPGDILLKKVFPEFNQGLIEAAIVQGQSQFRSRDGLRAIYNQDRVRLADFQIQSGRGGHYSEHAALAVSETAIAEAVGPGVVCTAIKERRCERYVVWRCKDSWLKQESTRIASRLAGAQGPEQIKYNVLSLFGDGGAFNSNYKDEEFTEETRAYLINLRDYAHPEDREGMGRNALLHGGIEGMFCSEFVVACYQIAADVITERTPGLEGTLFGVDPRAMSPMRMELALVRTKVFDEFGKFDYENDLMYSVAEQGISDYEAQSEWFPSDLSKKYLKVIKGEMALAHDQGLEVCIGIALGIQPKGPYGMPIFDKALGSNELLYKCLVRAVMEKGADKLFSFRGNMWHTMTSIARASMHMPRGSARVALDH